jgi:hypothetical protein
MENLLPAAGFRGESAVWNHPEGRYTYKQPGDGIVLHMVLLEPPADIVTVPHFDAGGGKITSGEHRGDYRSGQGPSGDEVTTALGRTGARNYLTNISPSMDKLVAQPTTRKCAVP